MRLTKLGDRRFAEKDIVSMSTLNENFLQHNIGHHSVKALVDTGASISCVSEGICHHVIRNYHNKVQQKSFLGEPVFKAIRGACGEVHPVRGTLELLLDINGLKIPHTFHVFPKLQSQLILGMDFLKAYRASIDLGESTISFYEGAVKTHISVQQPLPNTVAQVKNVYATTLKPRSQTSVTVKVPVGYDNCQVLIEPTKAKNKTKFLCAKTVDHTYHQKYGCWCDQSSGQFF